MKKPLSSSFYRIVVFNFLISIHRAWPISYADLEAYYTEAEQWYHVHGQRGSDPTEHWASSQTATFV